MKFEYLEPSSLEEAVSLLTKHHDKAKIIAGGTDLIVQMRRRLTRSQFLIDIKNISGLNYIDHGNGEGTRIGALTTISALEKSSDLQQHYPIISQAAGVLGCSAIRNMATLGGNLCNAAPSADTAPALIALSSKAKIAGPEGQRLIQLEDFFKGPGESALKRGELLEEIEVPPSPPGSKAVYLKHTLRGTAELAIVGVAVILTLPPGRDICEDIKIVLGAVAPTPIRALNAEKQLIGKRIDPDRIRACAQAAVDESLPISDVRASEEYRKAMIKVLTKKALQSMTDQNV
jgi:carbon-monoxide dehydrogenase medium subunit